MLGSLLASKSRERRGGARLNANVYFSLIFSMLAGFSFGGGASFVIACALVEITLSPFFAATFGALFLVAGTTIGWQLFLDSSRRLTSGSNTTLLSFFALLVLLSGAVCFMLELDWSATLSPAAKGPLYTLLGISLSFSLHFSAADLLIRLRVPCFASQARSLLSTRWQAKLLAVTSGACGLCYGVAFAVMDLEDALTGPRPHLRSALQRESQICLPIGAAGGAVTALIWRILERIDDPDLQYLDERDAGDL
jgi:hypothetical protein